MFGSRLRDETTTRTSVGVDAVVVQTWSPLTFTEELCDLVAKGSTTGIKQSGVPSVSIVRAFEKGNHLFRVIGHQIADEYSRKVIAELLTVIRREK